MTSPTPPSPPAPPPRPPQLHMLWPTAQRPAAPAVSLPAGYGLRQFGPDDAPAYLALMHLAGFGYWNPAKLEETLAKVLPGGFFLVEESATGRLVATAMATHCPMPVHPFGGELGWVAGDPAHAGRGLGRAVCSAVLARYLAMGYERIYLKTDDWRLPAIKVYLDLGFLPFLYLPEMPERWRAVCEKLGWAYTPEQWPGVG